MRLQKHMSTLQKGVRSRFAPLVPLSINFAPAPDAEILQLGSKLVSILIVRVIATQAGFLINPSICLVSSLQVAHRSFISCALFCLFAKNAPLVLVVRPNICLPDRIVAFLCFHRRMLRPLIVTILRPYSFCTTRRSACRGLTSS